MCAVRASSCSLISCTLPSSYERFTEKNIKSEELSCPQMHFIKKNSNPVLFTKPSLNNAWKDCVTSRNGKCHSWVHETVIWVSVKDWCDLALSMRSESGNDTPRSEEEKTAREVRQEGEGNSFPSLPLLLLLSCCRCFFVFRSLFHPLSTTWTPGGIGEEWVS